MPTFQPDDLTERETYFLLTSIVVPRPIAWVGTTSRDGVHNIAPHSFFNVVSSDPPVVHFTSTKVKDSLRNATASGTFTVSLVDRPLLEAMNTSAADMPPDVSEFDHIPVTKAVGELTGAPYVAESPAVMECTVRTTLKIGTGTMVFGDVRRFVIADRVWEAGQGRVDMAALDPVGRLSGSQYTLSEQVLRVPRPTWADVQAAEGP